MPDMAGRSRPLCSPPLPVRAGLFVEVAIDDEFKGCAKPASFSGMTPVRPQRDAPNRFRPAAPRWIWRANQPDRRPAKTLCGVNSLVASKDRQVQRRGQDDGGAQALSTLPHADANEAPLYCLG